MNTIRTKYPVLGSWDTRIGGRPVNQDSLGYLDTPYGLLVVVCDGMGGGPGGEIASQIAVQSVAEYFNTLEHKEDYSAMMKHAIECAHEAVLQKAEEEPSLRGMGTTIVAILFNDTISIIGHVGDSRLYQFRRGRKIFRTNDHSVVGEMVRNKTISEEQARLSGQSNVITRALGGKCKELSEVVERPYEKGDRFILCTDGIWGALPEPELIKACTRTPSISGTVDGLVLNINEQGRRNGNTHDNLTIALLETKTDSTKKEPMRRSVLYLIYGLLTILVVSLLANIVLYIKANRVDAYKNRLMLEQQTTAQNKMEIDSLKNIVGSLNKKVDESQVRVEYAREEVQRMKDEAEQKVKEANKRADEANQKAQKAESDAKATQKVVSKQPQASKTQVSDEVKKKIQAAINALDKARNMSEGQTRKQYRKMASNRLKELKNEDPRHKDIYQNIIEKLGNSIAQDNSDKAKGHYNALIKDLKSIIE